MVTGKRIHPVTQRQLSLQPGAGLQGNSGHGSRAQRSPALLPQGQDLALKPPCEQVPLQETCYPLFLGPTDQQWQHFSHEVMVRMHLLEPLFVHL